MPIAGSAWRVVPLACFLLCCNMARASDWSNMGTTGNALVLIDYETVRRNGQIVSAWFLIDYFTPQQDASGRTFSSSRRLAAFDCFKSTYATLQREDYAGQNAKDGLISTSSTTLAQARFIAALVDSLPYKVLRLVCR